MCKKLLETAQQNSTVTQYKKMKFFMCISVGGGI